MAKSYVEIDCYLQKNGNRFFPLVPLANIPPAWLNLFDRELTAFLVDAIPSNGRTIRMRPHKKGRITWSDRYLKQRRRPNYTTDFEIKGAGPSQYGSSPTKLRLYLKSQTIHILEPAFKDRRPLKPNPRRPTPKTQA